MRVFDMRLKRQNALGLHQLVERELHAQQLDIRRLVVLGAFDQRAHGAHGALDDRAGIADDECPDGSTKNDYEFPRLPQDFKMSAQRRVTTENATKDNNDTNNEAHAPNFRFDNSSIATSANAAEIARQTRDICLGAQK